MRDGVYSGPWDRSDATWRAVRRSDTRRKGEAEVEAEEGENAHWMTIRKDGLTKERE